MKLHSGLLCVAVCFATNAFAQVTFTPHMIETESTYYMSVYTIDVDGDGDMDVLAAYGNSIVWYENDGNEAFAAHTITTGASSAVAVHAADVDGDGDVDVLSASLADNEIAWFENDGNESFSTHIITTGFSGGTPLFFAQDVHATDIDGDGDTDVLAIIGTTYQELIVLYKNDGSENFSWAFGFYDAVGARSVYAEDVDGDGDKDVLSASTSDHDVNWYENEGNGLFTTHHISTYSPQPRSVHATDVDGDGDIDVLSASSNSLDSEVAWYENNGSENFTTHVITTDLDGTSGPAVSVFAEDVNGDGHLDVLSSSYDGMIAWYQNDGVENFTQHVISSDAYYAQSVYASDVDGDGDVDVLSGSHQKLVWYENTSPVASVNDIPSRGAGKPHLRANFPNPFNPRTTIAFDLPVQAMVSLRVFDVSGHLVKVLIDNGIAFEGRNEVIWRGRDTKGLEVPAGVYFCRLDTGSLSETKKIVLVK